MPNVDVPLNKNTWPACLDKVIKVGGERASSANGFRQIGVGADGIDFFAKDTTNDNQEGNSFAAPRIAAAYAKLHSLFPLSTVQEKTNALNAADTLMDSYTTSGMTFTARKIEPDQLAAAVNYLRGIYPPTNVVSDQFLIADNSSYGNHYGSPASSYQTTLDYTNARIGFVQQQKANTEASFRSGEISSMRDVELSFIGVMSSSQSGAGFDLLINGSVITDFTSYSGTNEKLETFVINRNFFIEGSINTIELRPKPSSQSWGIRNVILRDLPIIDLQVGSINSGIYGKLQNPTRHTGLRAKFNLNTVPKSGVFLSMTGWDIDTNDETEVFVNGSLIGKLTPAETDSTYGVEDVFNVYSGVLQIGDNYIELVQSRPSSSWSGIEDEKWAVKDILVKPQNITIVPIIMLLLDEDSQVHP